MHIFSSLLFPSYKSLGEIILGHYELSRVLSLSCIPNLHRAQFLPNDCTQWVGWGVSWRHQDGLGFTIISAFLRTQESRQLHARQQSPHDRERGLRRKQAGSDFRLLIAGTVRKPALLSRMSSLGTVMAAITHSTCYGYASHLSEVCKWDKHPGHGHDGSVWACQWNVVNKTTC